MNIEKRFKINQIREYPSDHIRSWIPLLPFYAAFNKRLNRFGEAFKLLDTSKIHSGLSEFTKPNFFTVINLKQRLLVYNAQISTN